MAKQLLVRTPQTTDGNSLRYDDNRQVVYKETILPISARKQIESINAKKPEHLKAEIKIVDDTQKAAPAEAHDTEGEDSKAKTKRKAE